VEKFKTKNWFVTTIAFVVCVFYFEIKTMSAELIARTKSFAVRIIKFIQVLPANDKVAQILGNQLLRSATSIGANYRSALRGRSDKDFISRIGIAEEEADETIYWLELFVDAGIVRMEKLTLLIQEAKELTAIMTSIGRTKKDSVSLKKSTPAV
jgi:four helix bundle protein